MFGVIVYIGACLVVSGFLTFMYVITRPVKNRDEIRSWRVWIATFLVTAFLPYAAFEAQTRMVGDQIRSAVQEAAEIEGIDGDVKYYKVLYYDGSDAHVTVVGEEPSSWGGTDHPVLRVKLTKRNGSWDVAYSNIVYSDNRNIDGVVFPPFW